MIMRPGKTYKFKVPSQYSGSTRPIQGDTEGDLNNFNYRKGNIVRVWKFYGTTNLFSDDPNETAPGLILSGLALTHIWHIYGSYYTMDDAIPDSASVNTLATTVPASNAFFNATDFTAGTQNGYRVQPYTVVGTI